jgi:hypothetical protein
MTTQDRLPAGGRIGDPSHDLHNTSYEDLCVVAFFSKPRVSTALGRRDVAAG